MSEWELAGLDRLGSRPSWFAPPSGVRDAGGYAPELAAFKLLERQKARGQGRTTKEYLRV